MKLRPENSLIYLYYKCSKCGEEGDTISIEQAKQKGTTHYCEYCGKVDHIEQIEEVVVRFVGQKKKRKRLNPDTEFVYGLLVEQGYLTAEATTAIEKARLHNPKTKEELFRLAVLEHSKG